MFWILVLDSVMLHRGKDVDHRNLISLTGSPGDHSQQTMTKNNKRNSYKEKVVSNVVPLNHRY